MGSGPAVAALCRLGGFVHLRVHSAVAQVEEKMISLSLLPEIRMSLSQGDIPGSPGSAGELRWITELRNSEGGKKRFSFNGPLHCVQPFRQTDSATRETTLLRL